jgi:transcriptional antiterminator RfaH
MEITHPAWYCVRTKPKHEHIAAANVRKHCTLEVFQPQLRIERPTRRGLIRVTEPLFPCYFFVRCEIGHYVDQIRYSNGVSTIVRFGDRMPPVPDSVIAELQACFPTAEPMRVDDTLAPGTEVVLTDGAFAGVAASVLRVMPARRRVEVLFDILGRPTAVEVDRSSVALEKGSLADLVPFLAALHPGGMRLEA